MDWRMQASVCVCVWGGACVGGDSGVGGEGGRPAEAAAAEVVHHAAPRSDVAGWSLIIMRQQGGS